MADIDTSDSRAELDESACAFKLNVTIGAHTAYVRLAEQFDETWQFEGHHAAALGLIGVEYEGPEDALDALRDFEAKHQDDEEMWRKLAFAKAPAPGEEVAKAAREIVARWQDYDAAMATYFAAVGAEHDDGCPEDDTCECPHLRRLADAEPALRKAVQDFNDLLRDVAPRSSATGGAVAVMVRGVVAGVERRHRQTEFRIVTEDSLTTSQVDLIAGPRMVRVRLTPEGA